jgi:hypothetical protein
VAVGTARGAGREADVLKRTSTTYLSFSHFVEATTATVFYDGQQIIGTIIKRDEQHEAFDFRRRYLGSFRKRIDAIRAVRCGAVS